MTTKEQVTVQLVRSLAGVPESQRRIIKSLGLTKKVGSRRTLPLVNPIIGQINAVGHLISFKIEN
jgi:ribosomal protein L30